MIKVNSFFKMIITIELILILRADNNLSYRYTGYSSLRSWNCDTATKVDNPAMFSSVNLPETSSFSGITFTGWVQLKGSLNYFYSILQLNNNISPYPNIYQLKYNPVEEKFLHKLKDTTVICTTTNMRRNWIYFKVIVTLDPTHKQDTVEFEFLSENGVTCLINPLRHYPTTSTNNMSVFTGKTIQLYFGPLCGNSQQLLVYLNSQPINDLSEGLYHRKYAIFTFRRQHYDFFYSEKNLNSILSFESYQDFYVTPQITTTSPIKIAQTPSQSQLCLNDLSQYQQSGCIVYFEFSEMISSALYFEIRNSKTGVQLINLFQDGNTLKYSIESAAPISIRTFDSTIGLKEYQAAIIFNSFIFNELVLVIMYAGGTVFKYEHILANNIMNTLPCFGDSNSSIQINNIRIYKGSMVGQFDNCLLHTVGYHNDCLFCKPGFALSYQKDQKCVYVGMVSPLSAGISTWSRSNCPRDMMHYNLNAKCTCRFSMFKSDLECKLCPRYCSGCSDLTTCLTKNTNRDATLGTCPTNLFDDGYDCVTLFLVIPERENLYEEISPIGSTRLSLVLSLNSGIPPKLSGYSTFSTVFYINQIRSSTTNYFQSVFVFKNDDQPKLMVTIQRVEGTYSLCFFHIIEKLDCHKLNPNQSFWLSIWFSFSKYIYQTIIDGTLNTTIKNISGTDNQQFINPEFCFGACKSPITTHSSFDFVTPGKDIVRFYRGVTDPNQLTVNFSRYLTFASRLLADFVFSMTTSNISPVSLSVRSPLQSNIISQTLDISSATHVHLYKGVANNNNKNMAMSFETQDIPSNTELAVSLNMFIEQIDSDYEFMSFNMGTSGGTPVSYKIIHQISLQYAIIEICVDDNECVQTLLCKLYYSEPNFIMILMRFKNTHNSGTVYSYLRYEVICNYRIDTNLRFLNTFDLGNMNDSTGLISDIKFPPSSSGSIVYLNNIRLFEGSDEYIDFRIADIDPCFVYMMSAPSMRCVKAKQGYTLFQYSAIPIADCNLTLVPNRTVVVHNTFTQECFDTQVYMPLCKELDPFNLSKCIACMDIHAEPENGCQCKAGYFFSPIKSICEKCDIQCESCYGSSSNCILCLHDGTIPPSCLCENQGQYTKDNLSCGECGIQCGACEGSATNCLTCSSERRINPPICSCDPIKYQPSFSLSDPCFPIVCSSRCETCENSASNCTSCPTNRELPPNCNCEQGHYESPNSSVCLKCETGTLYDATLARCIPCNNNCKECKGTPNTCIVCSDDSIQVKDGMCLCQNGNPLILNGNSMVCSMSQEVKLKVQKTPTEYQLLLIFEYDLEPIDFTENPIDSLVNLYFISVSSEVYSIKSQSIQANILTLSLSFTSSFTCDSGFLTFLSVLPFKNNKNIRILNSIYKDNPIAFQMGPFFISDAIQESIAVSGSSYVVQFLQEQEVIINIIKQLQFMFNLLNTVQASSTFLLIQSMIPPNLYSVLQITGSFIFPNVSNYGVEVSGAEQQTSIFSFKFDEGSDYTANTSHIFRQLGFNSCIILSIPFVLVMYFIWQILFLSGKIIAGIGISNESVMNKLNSANRIIRSQIDSANETSLLILVSSIFNQFKNIQEIQLLSRISVYLSILALFAIGGWVWSTFKSIRNITSYSQDERGCKRSRNNNQSNNHKQESPEQVNLEFRSRNDKLPGNPSRNTEIKSQQSVQLLEKMKDDEKFQKRIQFYFFLQLAKKYLIAVLVALFEDSPSVVCGFCFGILFVSLVNSIHLRPYKYMISNFAKIVGEMSLIGIYLLYLFVFLPFNSKIQKREVISDDETQTFLDYGNFGIALFCIFNLTYFIELIFVKIVFKIIAILQKRRADKQAISTFNVVINSDINIR